MNEQNENKWRISALEMKVAELEERMMFLSEAFKTPLCIPACAVCGTDPRMLIPGSCAENCPHGLGAENESS